MTIFYAIYIPFLFVSCFLICYTMVTGQRPFGQWKRKWEHRGREISELKMRITSMKLAHDQLKKENNKLARENAMLRDEYCIHGLP